MAKTKDGQGVAIPIYFEVDTKEALKDMEDFANKAKADISAFQSAKRILDGFEKSARNAFTSENIDKFSLKILDLQRNASEAARAILKNREVFKEVFERQSMIENLDIGEVEKKFRELNEMEDRLKAERRSLSGTAGGRGEYYQAMEQAYTAASKLWVKLIGVRRELEEGGKKGSTEWERINAAVKKASDTMDQYMANMRNAANTPEAEKARKRIEEIERELEKLKPDLEETQRLVNRLRGKVGEGVTVDNAFLKNFAKLSAEVSKADLEIEELRKSSERLSKSGGGADAYARGFYLIRTAVNDISKGLNNLIAKFKQLGKSILDAAKNMLRLNKEGTKTHNSLNTGFKNALKNILRYGFGIRSLYFLFRRLRKYAKESLDEMAKSFPEVNTQMSRAVTALNKMKGALGTAIQPLLNVVVPVLEKVANLISRILSLIGSVFAMFTGQGKIYQAVATQTDYAASLDKTGASAKKAKKELEGYLSPIDEINKYKDKDKDDDSGGLGDAGYKLMEVPVDPFAQKIKDIIDKILKPIKEAWARVGEYVKQAWTRAFTSVKKLLADIGNDFLKMWNQEATIKMWENIFRIVANIGNIIDYLAKGLDEAWNKNEVGLHILEKIRDIFAIIIEHILSASRYTVDWARNLDFYPLLSAFDSFLESLKPMIDSIAGVVEDFYRKVILPLTKWTIEKGLPELLGVFEDFNNKVDWEHIRAKLSELWTALEPFAERIGEGLILFIDDVSEKLADFLNSETFDKLIDKVIEFVNSVTAEDVKGTIWGIVNAFIALKAAATGFEILGKVALFLKEISLIAKNWSVIGGIIGTISGIILAIGGLITAIASIVDMVKNGWSVISTILEAVGIALAVIGAIILGAPALVAAVVGGIIFAISQIAIIIHDNWDAIKDFFVDLWDSIVSIWNGFVDWIKTHVVDPVTSFFKKLWSEVKKIWNDISSLWSKAKDWFKSNVVDPIVAHFTKFSHNVKAIFEGLWIIIKAIWIVVSTWFNNHVIQPLLTLWNNFKAKVQELWTNLVTLIKAIFSPLVNWIRDNIITPIQNAWDKFKTFISDLFRNIVSSIKETFREIVGWISANIINPIVDAFHTFKETVLGITNAIWEGIQNGAKAAFNGVMSFFERAINGIIDGVNRFFGLFNAAASFAGKITGDSYSGIQLIDHVSLPRLAKGAVIPPNKEFMAMLGDQKSGTNIETPLSTMVEAFNTALKQNGNIGRTEINFLLPDRRKVAQYVVEGGRIIRSSTGRNPFELA